MPQPKFVYDNMRDWITAKEIAKRKIEEEGISPALKHEREKYFNKLDDWCPTYLEDVDADRSSS